jgi:hypothetical protein
MLDWLTRNAWWVTGLSFLIFVLGLLAAATLVIRMPADHFVPHASSGHTAGRPGFLHVVRLAARNLVGICLLLAGVVLSLPLVPGPGFVLILLGVSLMDFPGKRKLELRILRTPFVLHPINRLRARVGRPPLRVPDEDQQI